VGHPSVLDPSWVVVRSFGCVFTQAVDAGHRSVVWQGRGGGTRGAQQTALHAHACTMHM